MSNTDQQLNAGLRAIEIDPNNPDPNNPDRNDTLIAALASSNNRLAGRAAKIIGQSQLNGFEQELRDAYQRFLKNPLKNDRGCEAKTPLCEALRQIEHDDADFFLEGIRYRQLEPGFGGETDTAAELRAICGFALIQLNDSRAMGELVDLLGDPEKTSRAGAARAIAHGGGQTGILLLRLKIDSGDSAPEVLGECFAGLLQLDPEEGIPRIAKFLAHPNENVCCEAALALGETHSAAAFLPLKKQVERHNEPDYENVLLTAMGLLSVPASIDYLLQVLVGPDTNTAIAAIRALRHCRDPRSFGGRLHQSVSQTNNRQINQVFAIEFPELQPKN